MKIEQLEIGKEYVTGDSYGYTLVVMTTPPRKNEEHGPDWIESTFKSVKTGIEAVFGYNTKYSVYGPNFWNYEDWLNYYPPEYRDKVKNELS